MKVNLTLIFFVILFLIESIQSEKMLVKVTKESDLSPIKPIGPKGTFDLITDTKNFLIPNQFNEKDSTKFEANFRDSEGLLYIWKCSLITPEAINIVVNCEVDEKIMTSSSKYFSLERGKVQIGEYNIEISSDDNYHFYLDISQLNEPFIFQENNLTIKIKYDDNQETKIIGRYSYDSETGETRSPTISFVTDYDDTDTNIFNILDIEEKTHFEMIFQKELFNGLRNYPADCRLWKPQNDKLRLLCNSRYMVTGTFNFTKASFIYNDYIVYIETDDHFKSEFTPDSLSFLYYEKQFIDLDSQEDIYYLKFKYDNYLKEALYLYKESTYIPLDNCQEKPEEKEITCSLKKSLIEQNLISKGIFELWAINDDIGITSFDTVLGIDINCKDDIVKETLSVEITSPEELNSKTAEITAFKTNSVNSPNIVTDKFNISFIDTDKQETKNYLCYLKSSRKQDYLNLLCSINDEGTFVMAPQNINLENIHYKYNFVLSKKEDSITFNVISSPGSSIIFTYPNTFDFGLKETVTLKFLMSNNTGDILITQNDYASKNETLNCSYINNGNVQYCIVPISFFEGNKDGYFYIYHSGIQGETNYAPYYEATPFYLTLPPNNLIVMRIKETIESNIGINGILYFETDYNDNVKNIFNEPDIEDKLSFASFVTDENGIIYNVTCKLWNPKNENVGLFCFLNESLKNSHQTTLNTVNFTYKDYNIIILSEAYNNVHIKSYDYEFPFLYSENQAIELNDEKETYELKFKIIKYNNEFIFLKKSDRYIIVLDNCKIQGKELVCSIEKSRLEKNLPTFGSLSLYYLIEEIGVYQFNSVLNIDFKSGGSIKKEDIYVNINNLLNNENVIKGIVAYETNISSFKEIITDIFYLDFNFTNEAINYECYLKKNKINNLLLYCYINSFGLHHLYPTYERKILSDIHYKYNFIIAPVNNKERFKSDSYIKIYNIYPDNIDLISDDSKILRYFINEECSVNFKLNLNSSDLRCSTTDNIIKCKVTKSHFGIKKSGYYFTYFMNYNNSLEIEYYDNPIYVKLPEDKDTYELKIKEENNKNEIKVGISGILYFIADDISREESIYDPSDIEEKTKFNTTIVDEQQNKYDVNCRLFKPSDENIAIICNLNQNLKKEEQNIKLSSVTITYKDYHISIISEAFLKVKQLNYKIPFIYSDCNVINLEKDVENYELKFKYESYYNEILYIYGTQFGYTILDDCITKIKEIICKLPIDKIGSVLVNNNEQFKLGAMHDNIGNIEFDLVYGIYINQPPFEKIHIYVDINKLLENATETGSIIAYETDIDRNDISELITDKFIMEFDNGEQYCYFKKNSANNLLLLCMVSESGEIHLKQIKNEKYLDKIHYKYNFRIQPFENNEIIHIDQLGSSINCVYPEYLDFSLEDSLTIRYLAKSPLNLKNLKINPDTDSYIECEDLTGMKKCIVSKSHFGNKEIGYYYTHFINHLSYYSIHYDANPFYFKLPVWEKEIEIGMEELDNINNIIIGKSQIFVMVTNYIDRENIFNETEIENYYFPGNFFDSDENRLYKSTCNFWKRENEKLRLICQIKDYLLKQEQNINFNNIKFIYNDTYKITINFNNKKILITEIVSDISFIYSDKQDLNINSFDSKYYLTFHQNIYDERTLYLYKNEQKYIKLDTNKFNNDLNCTVNKDELMEILSYSGEKFYLAEKLESEGWYIFNLVLDITINSSIDREEINVKVGKLLTPIVAKNEYIAYDTNMEKVSTLITDPFELESENNEKIKCIFKKNINRNNLLLLCEATKDGKYKLGKIKSLVLDNISAKYKIRFEEFENNEEFEVSNEGTKIFELSPLELDFTKNDSYIIRYETKYPDKLNGLQLNIDSKSELECENKKWYKECIVIKSHFSKNGNYYTYHTNYKGTKTISYEAPLIKVIYSEEGEEEDDENDILIIALSVAGGIILLGIIALIIYCCLKKRNKKDADDIKDDQKTMPLTSSNRDSITQF